MPLRSRPWGVAFSGMDEFVAGGPAERMVDPRIKVGQGLRTCSRSDLWGSTEAWTHNTARMGRSQQAGVTWRHFAADMATEFWRSPQPALARRRTLTTNRGTAKAVKRCLNRATVDGDENSIHVSPDSSAWAESREHALTPKTCRPATQGRLPADTRGLDRHRSPACAGISAGM